MSKTGKWISGINVLLGVWLVIAPFLFFAEITVANFWNDVIIGAAIIILAGYNFMKADDLEPVSVGAAALVALLGLWMIIAPFVFFAADAARWSDVIVGIIVAILGGYNAYQARSVEKPVEETTTTGAERP